MILRTALALTALSLTLVGCAAEAGPTTDEGATEETEDALTSSAEPGPACAGRTMTASRAATLAAGKYEVLQLADGPRQAKGIAAASVYESTRDCEEHGRSRQCGAWVNTLQPFVRSDSSTVYEPFQLYLGIDAAGSYVAGAYRRAQVTEIYNHPEIPGLIGDARMADGLPLAQLRSFQAEWTRHVLHVDGQSDLHRSTPPLMLTGKLRSSCGKLWLVQRRNERDFGGGVKTYRETATTYYGTF